MTTITTDQIELADRYAEERYGDRIEDAETNELGIVYTLISGQVVLIRPDGTVSEHDLIDPDATAVVIGRIIGFVGGAH